MNTSLSNHLAHILGEQIENIYPVSGGDISSTACIETTKRRYFVKYNNKSFVDNFASEANGLNTLRNKSRISIPEVISMGIHAEHSYLILNYIQGEHSSNQIHEELGYGLAELHRHTQVRYGHDQDNYIGSLRQLNTWTKDWPTFYGRVRLEPLFQQGFDLGLFQLPDLQDLSVLIQRLEQICPYEPPALIHGDLWSGNWMSSGDQAYLIDPSVSYAHREMDLAMTQLFGGFASSFYDAYHESYPIEPNFSRRIDVYQLYYLLVHAILFQGGYIQSVKRILRGYGG